MNTKHTPTFFAIAHGYIVSANADGTVPLSARVYARVDSADDHALLAVALVKQANSAAAYDELVEALGKCADALLTASLLTNSIKALGDIQAAYAAARAALAKVEG